MPTCNNCGAKFAEGSARCVRCGAPLRRLAKPIEVLPESRPPGADSEPAVSAFPFEAGPTLPESGGVSPFDGLPAVSEPAGLSPFDGLPAVAEPLSGPSASRPATPWRDNRPALPASPGSKPPAATPRQSEPPVDASSLRPHPEAGDTDQSPSTRTAPYKRPPRSAPPVVAPNEADRGRQLPPTSPSGTFSGSPLPNPPSSFQLRASAMIAQAQPGKSPPSGTPAFPDPATVPAGLSQMRDAGSVVGTYRILSLLGEGGMGRVYLAEHLKLGRRVAMKMLRSEYATNASAVKRFFDEARAVNQIRHENIIEVTDFVEGEAGESYFIMELLVGTDLAQLQHARRLPLPRILHLARQMASALSAAHTAGIVHRDLKPENIFIVERHGDPDFVKILDFGVAKLVDRDEYAPSNVKPGTTLAGRTQAGAILGTPEYMSPEQAGGTAVDPRTDIYSFGVMLYELVTGRRPFSGRSFGDYVVAHLSVAPPRPSQVRGLTEPMPPALEELIMECLAKAPTGRPANMREVDVRLAALEDPGLPALGGRRFSRRPLALIGATLGLAALGAFTARGLTQRRTPVPTAATGEVTSKVKVSFDSTPRGAEVFLEGREPPLGVTPLEWSTDRSSQLARFEFRFPGRERAWQEIPLTRDSSVSVALALLAPAPGSASNPAPSGEPASVRRLLRSAHPVRAKPGSSEPGSEPSRAADVPTGDRDAVADPFAE